MSLNDGSGLRLTTARYYTPKDRSIQTTGIKPDIVVEPRKKSNHPVVREKDLSRHLENDTETHGEEADVKKGAEGEDRKDEPAEKEEEGEAMSSYTAENGDVQLQRAVDLLKGWHVFKNIKDAA
jgi:carboxyl-terminal processing protease